jgi:hypothetical protein
VRLGRTKDTKLLGEFRPDLAEEIGGCMVTRREGNVTIQHRGPFGGVYTTWIEPRGDHAFVKGGTKAGILGTRVVAEIPPPRHTKAMKELGLKTFETISGRVFPAK